MGSSRDLFRIEVDTAYLDGLKDSVKKGLLRGPAAEALNIAIHDVKREADAIIENKFQFKDERVGTLTSVSYAKPDKLKANLKVHSNRVPLINFPYEEFEVETPVGVRRGVRVKVGSSFATMDAKGRSGVGKMFVAQMRSGHLGIFVRRGLKRLPISELFRNVGKSAYSFLSKQPEVMRKLQALALATFNKEFVEGFRLRQELMKVFSRALK